MSGSSCFFHGRRNTPRPGARYLIYSAMTPMNPGHVHTSAIVFEGALVRVGRLIVWWKYSLKIKIGHTGIFNSLYCAQNISFVSRRCH